MNPKALKTLEYNKIIDKLTEFAGSALAKEMCRNLQPSTDLYEIQALQKETSDALSRIYQKGAVSFRGVRDIRGSIKRLEIGAIIGINELLSICSLLDVCSKVKAYSRNDRDPDFEDSLEAMFQALQPLTPVSSEIRRCIASEEELNDDASPALFKIRRSMRQINDKVHAQLQTMVNGSARTYLQDAVVTMRNGRYCIPVKAEHRGQIPGMIHDQSSTGSTLFVEPMAVIKLNNDLRELELKEEKEIAYAVGCMFGRYSVDEEGLIYAGGEWNNSRYKTFIPDEDNCIPITDEEYFSDDIVGRFVEFVKAVYGADTLEENLDGDYDSPYPQYHKISNFPISS